MYGSRTLLKNLATLIKRRVRYLTHKPPTPKMPLRPPSAAIDTAEMLARPAPLQQRAFTLLSLPLHLWVASSSRETPQPTATA